MSRKKRKKIQEQVERELATDENYQALLKLIERAKIELATGKRPPPDPAPTEIRQRVRSPRHGVNCQHPQQAVGHIADFDQKRDRDSRVGKPGQRYDKAQSRPPITHIVDDLCQHRRQCRDQQRSGEAGHEERGRSEWVRMSSRSRYVAVCRSEGIWPRTRQSGRRTSVSAPVSGTFTDSPIRYVSTSARRAEIGLERVGEP